MATKDALRRAEGFAKAFGLGAPILLAPMAGACPPALSAAVAEAGGMGACGGVLMAPGAIAAWAEEFRMLSVKPFQINLWTADPAPTRDAALEAAWAARLSQWAPTAPLGALAPRDFDAQFEAALAAAPDAFSTIMGLLADRDARALRDAGIPWLATATTLAEARRAAEAGADAIIVQGMEAGGHRGAFVDARADVDLVGLFALIPAVADALDAPVIAAGGIADARGVAAALMLGASAVMIGTAFLGAEEAALPRAWSEALSAAAPEDTQITRAFSGRPGRALRTEYIRSLDGAPPSAPYPVQRALTEAMRTAGARENDLARMQAWAGQSAALAKSGLAGDIVGAVWSGAQALLG